MPPRGHYLAWEAGALAGVSGQKIGQWARRGYIRASQSEEIPKVYSFQDIAEAMVVHDLLDHKVTHREIRHACRALHEYGDWPLTEAPLKVATTGKTRLRVQRGEETYDVGRGFWQALVAPEHLTEIRSQLRRGGWAVRELPDLEHIQVDPDLLSGRPVIRGHRIAAQEVAESAEDTNGMVDLVEGYGLHPDEIYDARRWWTKVQRLAA